MPTNPEQNKEQLQDSLQSDIKKLQGFEQLSQEEQKTLTNALTTIKNDPNLGDERYKTTLAFCDGNKDIKAIASNSTNLINTIKEYKKDSQPSLTDSDTGTVKELMKSYIEKNIKKDVEKEASKENNETKKLYAQTLETLEKYASTLPNLEQDAKDGVQTLTQDEKQKLESAGIQPEQYVKMHLLAEQSSQIIKDPTEQKTFQQNVLQLKQLTGVEIKSMKNPNSLANIGSNEGFENLKATNKSVAEYVNKPLAKEIDTKDSKMKDYIEGDVDSTSPEQNEKLHKKLQETMNEVAQTKGKELAVKAILKHLMEQVGGENARSMNIAIDKLELNPDGTFNSPYEFGGNKFTMHVEGNTVTLQGLDKKHIVPITGLAKFESLATDPDVINATLSKSKVNIDNKTLLDDSSIVKITDTFKSKFSPAFEEQYETTVNTINTAANGTSNQLSIQRILQQQELIGKLLSHFKPREEIKEYNTPGRPANEWFKLVENSLAHNTIAENKQFDNDLMKIEYATNPTNRQKTPVNQKLSVFALAFQDQNGLKNNPKENLYMQTINALTRQEPGTGKDILDTNTINNIASNIDSQNTKREAPIEIESLSNQLQAPLKKQQAKLAENQRKIEDLSQSFANIGYKFEATSSMTDDQVSIQWNNRVDLAVNSNYQTEENYKLNEENKLQKYVAA